MNIWSIFYFQLKQQEANKIHASALQFVRLHTELNINLEGLEAISHLLQKILGMQNEMTALKNKLRMIEVRDDGGQMAVDG